MRGGARSEKGRSLSVNRILKLWNWFPKDEGDCSKKLPFPPLGLQILKGSGGLREGSAVWASGDLNAAGLIWDKSQVLSSLISRLCILVTSNIPEWKCDKPWYIFIGKARGPEGGHRVGRGLPFLPTTRSTFSPQGIVLG